MYQHERQAAQEKDGPPRLISSRCGNNNTAASNSSQISLGAPTLTLRKPGAKMNQELSVQQTSNVELSIIEQVVMQGDLSKLNPEQRVVYYNKVCESIGLNPFTKPFDYIFLNGKLTLYAKKDCTEQLRKINGISIEGLENKVVDDLYIVTAKARDRSGRVDESIGAVTIGGLKGDAKANAVMKAETKAKRRVTLSIAGLGWTDETEIETIPGAKKVSVDMSTGEINADIEVTPVNYTPPVPKPRITQDQINQLKMILDECSKDYRDYAYGLVLQAWKTNDLSGIPADQFERIKTAAFKNMEEEYARHKSESETQMMAVGVQ